MCAKKRKRASGLDAYASSNLRYHTFIHLHDIVLVCIIFLSYFSRTKTNFKSRKLTSNLLYRGKTGGTIFARTPTTFLSKMISLSKVEEKKKENFVVLGFFIGDGDDRSDFFFFGGGGEKKINRIVCTR